jgi:hypothetical protein
MFPTLCKQHFPATAQMLSGCAEGPTHLALALALGDPKGQAQPIWGMDEIRPSPLPWVSLGSSNSKVVTLSHNICHPSGLASARMMMLGMSREDSQPSARTSTPNDAEATQSAASRTSGPISSSRKPKQCRNPHCLSS